MSASSPEVALATAERHLARFPQSAMAQERDQLGEKITVWLKEHPNVKVVDKIVTQSSDEAFHCLSITLFYTE